MWPAEVDEVIAGDLTAALGYVTPAGGVVVTPVAPVGQRDRDRGRVSFTTSLGFGRKLDRIEQNPKVALAFHAREHGFCERRGFVLVQGTASYDTAPDEARLLAPRPDVTRFMGEPKTGRFWDRWLRAYYADRVLVDVQVERVVAWPDARCAEEPQVYGAPLPEQPPAWQEPPKGGTAPRMDAAEQARRLAGLPHALLGYIGGDGFPVVVAVGVGVAAEAGITLAGPLVPGGRRAGLLAHRYEPQLIGLQTRQHTGWLQDGFYAPHTAGGFRAPANRTVLLLANGFMARRGLKQARAAGRG